MSGALDGLEEALAGRTDAGSSYEPGGEPSVDFKVIDALVEFYLMYRVPQCELPGLLPDMMPCAREKDFDANEFLFWFVQQWAPAVDSGDLGWEIYLTEVVQVLYDCGHNDFVIDGSPLPAPMDFWGLKGAPERKLKVAYHARPAAEPPTMNPRQLPEISYVHECIAVVTGECGEGGKSSVGSVFVFKDHVWRAGKDATGSVFHLCSLDMLSSDAMYCSFYLWGDVPGDERLKELHKQGFFENNRLFACHEEGTHEQIVPCQQRSLLRTMLNWYSFRREECERPIPWEEYV